MRRPLVGSGQEPGEEVSTWSQGRSSRHGSLDGRVWAQSGVTLQRGVMESYMGESGVP